MTIEPISIKYLFIITGANRWQADQPQDRFDLVGIKKHISRVPEINLQVIANLKNVFLRRSTKPFQGLTQPTNTHY